MVKYVVKQFIDLLRESTITQALLVLCVFGIITFCVVSGREIPPDVVKFAWIIVGFFFGSKVTFNAMRSKEK